MLIAEFLRVFNIEMYLNFTGISYNDINIQKEGYDGIGIYVFTCNYTCNHFFSNVPKMETV